MVNGSGAAPLWADGFTDHRGTASRVPPPPGLMRTAIEQGPSLNGSYIPHDKMQAPFVPRPIGGADFKFSGCARRGHASSGDVSVERGRANAYAGKTEDAADLRPDHEVTLVQRPTWLRLSRSAGSTR
jgi:hypothetical protein